MFWNQPGGSISWFSSAIVGQLSLITLTLSLGFGGYGLPIGILFIDAIEQGMEAGQRSK